MLRGGREGGQGRAGAGAFTRVLAEVRSGCIEIERGMEGAEDEEEPPQEEPPPESAAAADANADADAGGGSDRQGVFTPVEWTSFMTSRRTSRFKLIESLWRGVGRSLAKGCAECLAGEGLVDFVMAGEERKRERRRRRRKNGSANDNDNDSDPEEEEEERGSFHHSQHSNYAFPPTLTSSHLKMPWSVAARQRTLCSKFLRLFNLAQLMVNEAFRQMFVGHTEGLLDMLLPGARGELEVRRSYSTRSSTLQTN